VSSWDIPAWLLAPFLGAGLAWLSTWKWRKEDAEREARFNETMKKLRNSR
jgi:hypothetical protein